MDTTRILNDALASINHLFQENELAYYSLTGKLENHFRDRLAFHLWRITDETCETELSVVREWKRFDIAIFDQSLTRLPTCPILIVELKAMHTYGAFAGDEYELKLNRDYQKAKKWLRSHDFERVPDFFTLLLSTHITSLSTGESEIAIAKYYRKFQRSLIKHNCENLHLLREKAAPTVGKWFENQRDNIRSHSRWCCLRDRRGIGLLVDRTVA